jgi:threonine aldolase
MDPGTVETNFVPIPDEPGLAERLSERGVQVGGLRQGWLRAVTHLDIEDEDIEQAIDRIQEVISVRV